MMTTLPVIGDGRGLRIDDDPEADLGWQPSEDNPDDDCDVTPLPIPPDVVGPQSSSQAAGDPRGASLQNSDRTPVQEVSVQAEEPRFKAKNTKQLNQTVIRPALGEAPPGAKYEHFEIAISRQPGTSLGIDLSPAGGISLLVGNVKKGAIADWNLAAGLGSWSNVCRGDRFVEVNGIANDTAGMIEKFKSENVFQIKVRRLVELQVAIQLRPGTTLGLSVSAAPPSVANPLASNCLFVRNIDSAGLAQDHNVTIGAEIELREGDRIVEVNGMVGTSMELLEALNAAEHVLQLHIMRPPPCGWPADVFQPGQGGW